MITMWIHKLLGCASFWKYRNPYDRTCNICGRRQQQWDRVFRREDDSGQYWNGRPWWEDVYPLKQDVEHKQSRHGGSLLRGK